MCSNSLTGLLYLLCRLQNVLNATIPVLITLGVVYFVWGVVQYVIADGEEAKTKGRDRIVFGIIGLAIIMSVWGLVTILTDTFITTPGSGAPTSAEVRSLLPQ